MDSPILPSKTIEEDQQDKGDPKQALWEIGQAIKQADADNGAIIDSSKESDFHDSNANGKFKNQGSMEEDSTKSLSHSITALLHLRCLVGFIDHEIKPKQEYIDSPDCEQIQFTDLWHLFKPGDEVIRQDEKQVFVVQQVKTPRHKVQAPWERWHQKSNFLEPEGQDHETKFMLYESMFMLHCAYIDFDGETFGPVRRDFKILPFGGLKSIKSLPVYPLRLSKQAQARQNIIQRGRMLLEVANFRPMYYKGVTLDTRDDVDSQVVIDFHEALADEDRGHKWKVKINLTAPIVPAPGRREAKCTALCCQNQVIRDGASINLRMTEDYFKNLIPDDESRAAPLIFTPRPREETLAAATELSDTELLVMTYRVFGFILRSRKWAQLDLKCLRHENANVRSLTVNAFERLELPEGHREMVKSLVVQHFRSRQSGLAEQTDLIQGKGKGLIMLLHGAPGVGKTTTAEGIAELFRKPLFQITCGDLGTTAKEVETELERNFALASRWGCVLLLDEADVFLSARERMDFTRNGLVSVFLRVLEYYTGILFLTTNRVGDFDEAFASRIHMSLYYPELDEDKTLKVFNLNLNLIQQRFDKQGRIIVFDSSAIESFAKEHFRTKPFHRWNGRQIRNACQTALALAEFDSQGGVLDIEPEVNKQAIVRLELKYFHTVQKAYLDFGKYLGDVQGTQGDRRAIDYKLRAGNDTPYQNKRSAFSSRQDSRSDNRQQNPNPQYRTAQGASWDTPQSNFGPQAGQSDQRYGPSTQSVNMSPPQGYAHWQSQLDPVQFQQGQQRNVPMANTGIHGGPADVSRQYQMDSQFSQAGLQSQPYGPPQMDNRTPRGMENARYPDPNYGSSPFSNQATQQQHQSYGHGISDQSDIAQNVSPFVQSGSYGPGSVARSGEDEPENQSSESSFGNYRT